MQADAFVLTSQVEPFGIVYIEAMMAGIPCIGTRGQGADDIITDNNGLLVNYGNVEQLAHAMRMIINERMRYDSEEIKRYVIEAFSEDSVVNRIEEIYSLVSRVI